MKYLVYQIQFTKDESEAINKLGWDLASRVMPRVRVHLEKESLEVVHKGFNEDLYEWVATIEANDLDDAFLIGNIGPEEQIERHSSMHSISVGDVLVADDGHAYHVSPVGFKEL